jgi:acetamidase/formamidase
MAAYSLVPNRATLHGCFSRDLPPVLAIDPGDELVLETLDAGWGLERHPAPGAARRRFSPREKGRDNGHALIGPIEVRGTEPGSVLAIEILELTPGTWGWTHAGGTRGELNEQLKLLEPPEHSLVWDLDRETGTARNQLGDVVALRPFLGIIGVAPAEPGIHSTWPPRATGGNLDCRELVAGSTLYLPAAVPGALLSVGDGHAAQGDGEVCTQAIECPMERVRLRVSMRPDMHLSMPRAETPAGWISFGLDRDLDRAMIQAVDGMLDLLHDQFGWDRKHALAMASIVASFRVTQVVNGVKGVHGLLPHGSVRREPAAGSHRRERETH